LPPPDPYPCLLGPFRTLTDVFRTRQYSFRIHRYFCLIHWYFCRIYRILPLFLLPPLLECCCLPCIHLASPGLPPPLLSQFALFRPTGMAVSFPDPPIFLPDLSDFYPAPTASSAGVLLHSPGLPPTSCPRWPSSRPTALVPFPDPQALFQDLPVFLVATSAASPRPPGPPLSALMGTPVFPPFTPTYHPPPSAPVRLRRPPQLAHPLTLLPSLLFLFRWTLPPLPHAPAPPPPDLSC
jgi:hypothetical protein